MEPAPGLIRPETLSAGKEYWRSEPPDGKEMQPPIRVIFASYTACPAVVVVIDGVGKRVRCLRDDLLLSSGKEL